MEGFFAVYRNLVRLAAVAGLLLICWSICSSFAEKGGFEGLAVRCLAGEEEKKSCPEKILCMEPSKDSEAFFYTSEERMLLGE